MQIFLNGESQIVVEGMTVEELVLTLAEDPRGIAIERNLEIVPKAEHGQVRLQEADRLEIVQFVGGG